MPTLEDLQQAAKATGFEIEPLEKVIRLFEILDRIRDHPFLSSRMVLKGGTALNFFVLDMPRLSVDIDLNYIGAVDRDTMLAERPRIDQSLRAVIENLGIQIRRVPGEHAGGKWRLSYPGLVGEKGRLDVDLNFLLRSPLWPPVVANSRSIGSFGASGVPVLNIHELAAGKLSALFGRTVSRDVFDIHQLLTTRELDIERLRFGFVVYGGINRRDWREISIDDVQMDPLDAERKLAPLLGAGAMPTRTDLIKWSEALVSESREFLSAVLPLRPEEREFLEHLNERGNIVPELLTADTSMQNLLREHPGLRWKALNVSGSRAEI